MKDFRNKISREIVPYVPGEQPDGLDYIKLNTNENGFSPSEKVKNAIRKLLDEDIFLRRYPHPDGEPLRGRLAKNFKIKNESVLITNGSDEALAIICRAFFEGASVVAFPEISYSFYSVLIESVGAKYFLIPMKKMDEKYLGVNLEGLRQSASNAIFLPNPNALTGELILPETLSQAISATPEKLWIIDEAYTAFAPPNSSMIPRLKNLTNCIVTGTFSKSHSLAGLRIGFAVSENEFIMKGLYAMKESYNEDVIAIHAGAAALEDESVIRNNEIIMEQREYVRDSLVKSGWYVFRSAANFLLASPPQKFKSEDIYHFLKKNKILVRYFKTPQLADFLRITIGNPPENDALLRKLSEF